MTIRLGRKSQKYGRFNYIYIILFIVIAEVITRLIFGFLIYRHSIYIIFISLFYISSCIICIYLLIGKRLLFVMNHPEDQNDYFDSVNITNFISLNKEEKKFYSNVNKIRHHKTNKNKNKNSKVTDEIDLITINPDNIFFNRSLKLLNQQNENSNIQEKEPK